MIDSNKTVIYSLSANKELTNEVAKILGVKVSPCNVNHFADGEVLCEPIETVREKDVYIIQSTCNPVTENLMEILVFVDALKRASARKINVVIPYFGYARQDRKAKPRQPITSKLVANLLYTAGVHRVITVELHAAQIQGFFDCLVDELTAIPLLSKYFKNKVTKDTVIVSPDHGGVNRARRIAERLNLPIAIIDKRRVAANVAEVMNIIGDVNGKDCLMIDDMIDTAGSCSAGAKLLKAKGAKTVSIACTHGVFSGPAAERLLDGTFDQIVCTDSIPLPEKMKHPKVKVLSLAPMIASVIDHIENGEAVSLVYDVYND
ncbi:MAG: ribose-phosphate pyrophosphokinase [Erysipelotrichaceae bacterium]|nr:ribose-phosphate pyrophosphokinase [Erysipelotrichaceae bacterium]